MFLQVVLIAGLIVTGIVGPAWPEPVRTGSRVAGLVLGICGLVLGIGGSLALGHGLTPLPRPRHHAVFVERGIYRLVRHPIYGGVILLGLAGTLWTSPLAVVLEAVLSASSNSSVGVRRRGSSSDIRDTPTTVPGSARL